jgi:hypothetical protein
MCPAYVRLGAFVVPAQHNSDTDEGDLLFLFDEEALNEHKSQDSLQASQTTITTITTKHFRRVVCIKYGDTHDLNIKRFTTVNDVETLDNNNDIKSLRNRGVAAMLMKRFGPHRHQLCLDRPSRSNYTTTSPNRPHRVVLGGFT